MARTEIDNLEKTEEVRRRHTYPGRCFILRRYDVSSCALFFLRSLCSVRRVYSKAPSRVGWQFGWPTIHALLIVQLGNWN